MLKLKQEREAKEKLQEEEWMAAQEAREKEASEARARHQERIANLNAERRKAEEEKWQREV